MTKKSKKSELYTQAMLISIGAMFGAPIAAVTSDWALLMSGTFWTVLFGAFVAFNLWKEKEQHDTPNDNPQS